MKPILTLKQPASLNRFVDDTIPLTFRKRWELAKPALAMSGGWILLMAERVALQKWATGETSSHILLAVLITVLTFAFFVAIVVETHTRIHHRMPRLLELHPRGPRFYSGGKLRLNPKWSQVDAFEFAPISGESFCKAALRMKTRKGKILKRWIVVQDPAAVEQLARSLQAKQQFAGAQYEIVQHSQPVESFATPAPLRLRVLLLFSLAILLFYNGALLIAVGTIPEKPPAVRNAGEPNRKALLARTQQILFWSGIGLSGCAVTLLICSLRMSPVKEGPRQSGSLANRTIPPGSGAPS